MPVTHAQKLASKVLRRLSVFREHGETTLTLAHRKTIYKIACGKPVENLSNKIQMLKDHPLPQRRRLHYKYDYDYIMQALIMACYNAAQHIETDPNILKLYLECMIDEETIRPPSSRNVINIEQMLMTKQQQDLPNASDLDHEQLLYEA